MKLGPYRAADSVGEGGMARVFKAVHEPTGQLVALKVFDPDDLKDASFIKRVRREIEVLEQVDYPHVVKMHGWALEEGVGYLALEYINGRTLEDLSRKQGKFAGPIVMRIATEMVGALGYLHGLAFFHRDIKPLNIMIETASKRSVLVDFGLVKAANMTAISQAGEIKGTLCYMAPEQFQGADADARTDLYQLGLVLYRLATAQDPPAVTDLLGLSNLSRGYEAYPKVRGINDTIPEGLETVIANCLHVSMEARYPSAHHMLDDLQKTRQGQPVELRKSASRSTMRMALPGKGPAGKRTATFNTADLQVPKGLDRTLTEMPVTAVKPLTTPTTLPDPSPPAAAPASVGSIDGARKQPGGGRPGPRIRPASGRALPALRTTDQVPAVTGGSSRKLAVALVIVLILSVLAALALLRVR